MSKVFVLNDPGSLDFSQAKKYGELVFLTVGAVDVFNPDRLMRDVCAKLKEWADEDYLLLSGSIVLAFLTALMLDRKHMTVIKVLIFDSKSRTYVVRTIGHPKQISAEA